MHVKVKQSHSVPKSEGGWNNRVVGDVIEIAPEEFADNLHEEIKEETVKAPKVKKE